MERNKLPACKQYYAEQYITMNCYRMIEVFYNFAFLFGTDQERS